MDCFYKLFADAFCERTEIGISLCSLISGLFSAEARGCQGGMNRIGWRYRLIPGRSGAMSGRLWDDVRRWCGDPQAYFGNR